MVENVTPLRPQPELLVGPFQEYRVVVDGRMIPRLTGFPEGDDINLVVDGRFSIRVPKDRAHDVAWLVAQAMAVASGYAHLGAETKQRPFAPQAAEIVLT